MTIDVGKSDLGRVPHGDKLFISGLGLAQLCSWGSLFYSFPLIAEAMERDLGWSKPALYGAPAIGIAISATLAYAVGVTIDRGRARMVMTGASIMAGLLLLVWSAIDSLLLFYLALAGIGAMQAATLYEPAFAVVARRLGAGSARGGILTVTLWGGFASTIFVPLIQVLLELVGWRGTLVALAAVNIFLCAGLYFLTIDPRRDRGMAAIGDGGDAPREAVRLALRNPVFWLLGVAFTAYSVSMTAFIFHLYPFLAERRFDAVAIGTIIMVIGPAQVAGRLFMLVLAPQLSARALGSVVVALFPVAVATIWLGPPILVVMAAAAALYGAINGVMTVVRGIVIPEMVSRKAYGALNGMLGTPTILARALAPLAGAWLWSLQASYDLPMLAMLLGVLVTAVAFWLAAFWPRPKS